MTTATLDSLKDGADLYKAGEEPGLIEVPPFHYAAIDGEGDPNIVPDFQDSVQALFWVGYAIKMLPKKGTPPPGYADFKVPPLEALWWNQPDASLSQELPRGSYQWTAMLRQPNFVSEDLVQEVCKALAEKRSNSALSKIKFLPLAEGKCVQAMHVGPYDQEKATIERMGSFAANLGLKFHGKHHEIYLSDPRRTSPENLKTILRHPVWVE